ncbi:MAG: NAD-dependent epimerase/dehydratase family protein [Planctomycetes bacterium]|nr:NAD-dependent epimerase/dehydratase family protein [Planctomycetota bacterium]
MTTALVTGGAGFIGSHLVERLLSEGTTVRVLDDFSTGRRENLAAVAADKRLTVIEGSVTDAALVASAVKGADEVYHLAAAVGVTLIVAQPVRTLETNVRGTETLLAETARVGARFFLASSSEVYGKSDRIPFDEDDDLLIGSSRFCRWGYACSKAVAEFLAMAYAREHGLPLVIGRLFNTIGPRQVGSYGMVVPRFVSAALQGEPLEVYGTGRQTRAFIDVRDMVEAIHRLTQTAGPEPQTFNIGGDHEISIADLATVVIGLTQSSSVCRPVSYEQAYGEAIDDMGRRCPSIARARAVLGDQWPHFTLKESLKSIIAAHRAG